MKFYQDYAHWWPLMSAPADYREEAELFAQALLADAKNEIRTVLELGSGGGNNACYLKSRFDMTLVEPALGMLEVSRALNPECRHLQGDMRTVRLGRSFDAVFVHDAVAYMTSEADLRAAIETARVHCRPGGVVLFAPDYIQETFRESVDDGGEDGECRSLRWMEWVTDPDPTDGVYTVDYAFMMREGAQPIQVVHDRHEEGLFPRAAWLRCLEKGGFTARSVSIEHSKLEPDSYQVFLGICRSRPN